jgi:hypothetical protein
MGDGIHGVDCNPIGTTYRRVFQDSILYNSIDRTRWHVVNDNLNPESLSQRVGLQLRSSPDLIAPRM